MKTSVGFLFLMLAICVSSTETVDELRRRYMNYYQVEKMEKARAAEEEHRAEMRRLYVNYASLEKWEKKRAAEATESPDYDLYMNPVAPNIKTYDDIDKCRMDMVEAEAMATKWGVKLTRARKNLQKLEEELLDSAVLNGQLHWTIHNLTLEAKETMMANLPAQSVAYRKKLAPGSKLAVHGTPQPHDPTYNYENDLMNSHHLGDFYYRPHRFYINLVTNRGDVALHFNPRFDEENTLANTYINGIWRREARWERGDFFEGVGFRVEIRNEDSAFKIYVNRDYFNSFEHRVDNSIINGIRIGGDVEIHSVQIL